MIGKGRKPAYNVSDCGIWYSEPLHRVAARDRTASVSRNIDNEVKRYSQILSNAVGNTSRIVIVLVIHYCLLFVFKPSR